MSNQNDPLHKLDRRNFLRLLTGGTLAITAGGLLTGCGGGGNGFFSNAGQGSSGPIPAGQQLNKGAISLPSGSPITPSQLTVQTTLDAGRPATAESGSSSGSYQVIASSQNNHLMMAVKNQADGSQTPYLLAISTGSAGTSPTVDENSTAAALVFLNPFIGLSDSATGLASLAQINALPETAALASAIKNVLSAGHSPLDGTDPNIGVALLAATQAQLRAITAKVAHSSPQRGNALPIVPSDTRSGISIATHKDVQPTGDSGVVIPLTVTNTKLRLLTGYYRPLNDTEGTDANARKATSKPINEYSGLKLFDSSAVAASDTVGAVVSVLQSGDLSKQQDVTLSGSANNRYVLSFYGIGDPVAMYDEAVLPTFSSLALFLVVPVAEIITGLPAKSIAEGIKDLIINANDLLINFRRDYLDFIGGLKSGDFLGAGKALLSIIVEIFNNDNFVVFLSANLKLNGREILDKALHNSFKFLIILNRVTSAIDLVRGLFDDVTSSSQTNFIIQLQGAGTVQITRLMPENERQLMCEAPLPTTLVRQKETGTWVSVG